MTYSLWPHQARAADMLTRSSGVLWHEMRVGKTRAALHAYNTLLNRGQVRDLVVVAPATIRAVWKEEAEAMRLGLTFIDVGGTKPATRRLQPNPMPWPVHIPRCYLLNPELLPHWLDYFQAELQVGRFVLIADESHLYLRCATGQTQRFRAFELLAKGTDHVWELSGTWYVRSALDVYWQLRPFGPEADPFFYTKKACYGYGREGCGKCFACRYCGATRNQFTSTGISYDGIKNERELFSKLPMVSVVREEDVRRIALPDRFPVWVGEGEGDWNPDIRLSDDQIEEAQRALIPRKALLAQAYLQQLRQGELRHVERPGRSLHEHHEPVVIFTWHVELAERLGRLLSAPIVIGATPRARRDQLRQEFMAGRIPVLIGNLQSLGMGIDLSAARWFLYAEPWYDAALHFQAEARGRGPNQRSPTLRHAYLLIRKSADEYVWRVRLWRGDAIERMYHAGREAGRESAGRYLEEAK